MAAQQGFYTAAVGSRDDPNKKQPWLELGYLSDLSKATADQHLSCNKQPASHLPNHPAAAQRGCVGFVSWFRGGGSLESQFPLGNVLRLENNRPGPGRGKWKAVRTLTLQTKTSCGSVNKTKSRLTSLGPCKEQQELRERLTHDNFITSLPVEFKWSKL